MTKDRDRDQSSASSNPDWVSNLLDEIPDQQAEEQDNTETSQNTRSADPPKDSGSAQSLEDLRKQINARFGVGTQSDGSEHTRAENSPANPDSKSNPDRSLEELRKQVNARFGSDSAAPEHVQAADSPGASDSRTSLEELRKRINAQSKFGDTRGTITPTTTEPAMNRDELSVGSNVLNQSGLSSELVADASNVLVLESLSKSGASLSCPLFFDDYPENEWNVMFISIIRPAKEQMTLLEKFSCPSPSKIGIITTEDQMSSQNQEDFTVSGTDSGQVTIDVIEDLTDLPRLGIATTKAMSHLEADNKPVGVCFHSLTALLQYINSQKLFRFLHVMQSRFNSKDITSHYHIDPEAHDDQTLITLRHLFDSVIKRTDNGEMKIVE